MISVIVPVYKVAPYVRQCIESIISQSYRDLEILLIDDGSPDECGEICEEYKKQDERIKVFHTENRGLSAARNLGLQNAEGDYVAFVDADDWLDPRMYETLAESLQKNGADICVCGYASGDREAVGKGGVYRGAEVLKALIDKKFNNFVWNKLYRRALFRDIRFPEGMSYEDVVIMHRVAAGARAVAVIPDALYHYRVRADSITKTYTAGNLMDYADAALDRYCFFRDEHPELYEEKREELLLFATVGISKVWRWWYSCNAEEKRAYNGRIRELLNFTKENIPISGFSSWPGAMRVSALFMHSGSRLAFAGLYGLNQAFRKLWPEKTNRI